MNEKYERKYASIATDMIDGKYSIPDGIRPLVHYCISLANTEKELVAGITAWVSGHPIYSGYLKHIAGIGPVLSANLISMIEPVERFEKPSKLIAYAGYSTQYYAQKCGAGHKFMSSSPMPYCPVRVMGEGDTINVCNKPIIESKFVKGVMQRKTGYILLVNTSMKTLMYKIGTSIERMSPDKSYYRRLYDGIKARYNSMDDMAKGHARMMALRYVEKRFLINLHVSWMYGLGHDIKPYESTLENHTIEPIELDDDTPLPAFASMDRIDTEGIWTIKQLTGSYYDVQKLRIKAFNNIVAYVKDNSGKLIAS